MTSRVHILAKTNLEVNLESSLATGPEDIIHMSDTHPLTR